MSLVDHPLWPKIREFIRLEIYGRDGGPSRKSSRRRIEFNSPPEMLQTFRDMTMPCVRCGCLMHPLRSRNEPGNKRGDPRLSPRLYFAASCQINKGCSKGNAASEEYIRVRKALGDVDE